jgi:hypothetical protein
MGRRKNPGAKTGSERFNNLGRNTVQNEGEDQKKPTPTADLFMVLQLSNKV